MQRPTPANLARRSIRGFTLIELMAVVVILGVLATVAIGAYMKHVRNARRTEVMANLSNLTLRQKNFLAVSGHYATSTNVETETYPTMAAVTAADDEIQWGIDDDGYTAKGRTGQYFRGGEAVHGFDAIRFLPEGGRSRCGYGTISGYGSNWLPASDADEPPFSQTLGKEVWAKGTTEADRFYARDWFYSFALCDFDHDSKFWAFTTMHADSEINYSDIGPYEQGE